MSKAETILQELNQHKVKLVAVSKTRSVAEIMELYNLGQRVFGENRVQELIEKKPQLPEDIEWHLIGHLQTNKVKQVLPMVSMIHAVDSLKLLYEIEEQGTKIGKKIKVLLQIHIAKEETKFGLNKLELIDVLEHYLAQSFPFTEIVGLMGMATNTSDEEVIHAEFKELKDLFLFVKNGYFINKPSFKEISMGMSSDYEIAIEEGSTMVRIGSLLFSEG